MPIHDWARVDDAIFHDFHLAWIGELQKALNRGGLPSDYYALAEQMTNSVNPDFILTLQGDGLAPEASTAEDSDASGGTLTLVRIAPQTRFTMPFTITEYVSRQRTLVIHHVSDDRIVAMLEIVSAGNKASNNAFRTFIEKAIGVLSHGCNLLLIDLYPPTPRDPQGIHAALSEESGGPAFTPPSGQPLTVAAYEATLPGGRAYVDTLAVGDRLPEAPLFLLPGGHVRVPLEATYNEAYSGVPRRWRRVLEASTPQA
jgi:hypothetical protein